LVRWSAVFGLKFVCVLGQLGERPSEGAGDAVGDVPSGVACACFDLAESAVSDPGRSGEYFLAQAVLASA
jgi:hypothetical protein